MPRLNGAGAEPGPAPNVRELYRSQLRDSLGNWSGMAMAAVPTVVFVAVNAITGLRPALYAAVGSAVLLAGYRRLRRQPLQQVLTGLVGVLIAALIAERSGQARNYFLLGIVLSFVYAVPFAVSVLVRRPLVGLFWEFLDPTPGPDGVAWYRRPPLLCAYTLATVAGTAVFLARGLVQWALYGRNATGWLAFARVAMGFPLYLAAVGFGCVIVTRARRRLAEQGPRSAPERTDVPADPPGSAQDRLADRRLGLRMGDEQ